MTQLITQLIETLLEEQPLALPGSAQNSIGSENTFVKTWKKFQTHPSVEINVLNKNYKKGYFLIKKIQDINVDQAIFKCFFLYYGLFMFLTKSVTEDLKD